MMNNFLNKIIAMAAISLFVAIPFSGNAEGEGTPEKELGLENVVLTYYALGGDINGLKPGGEAVYLAKGTPKDALITLKQIALEGRRPVWSFKMKDQVNIIVFRGVFPKLNKISIKKVLLKDSSVEIYAEYKDFSGSDIPSQPAAIIPVGKLLPGKYTAILFVDNNLQKKADFKVSR